MMLMALFNNHPIYRRTHQATYIYNVLYSRKHKSYWTTHIGPIQKKQITSNEVGYRKISVQIRVIKVQQGNDYHRYIYSQSCASY